MHAHDRRVCIYPSYINSKCTVAEGRRIPKDLACEAPNVLEIRDVLEKSMKLPCEVEDKFYPRDFWQRGRVRVTMRKEDGTPLAKEFPTKRSLMIEIARLVPKHPGRTPGSAEYKKRMPTATDILTQFTSQPGQAGANAGMGGLIFTALAAQAAGGAGPPSPQAQPQADAGPAPAEQAQGAAEDVAVGGQPEAEGGQ